VLLAGFFQWLYPILHELFFGRVGSGVNKCITNSASRPSCPFPPEIDPPSRTWENPLVDAKNWFGLNLSFWVCSQNRCPFFNRSADIITPSLHVKAWRWTGGLSNLLQIQINKVSCEMLLARLLVLLNNLAEYCRTRNFMSRKSRPTTPVRKHFSNGRIKENEEWLEGSNSTNWFCRSKQIEPVEMSTNPKISTQSNYFKIKLVISITFSNHLRFYGGEDRRDQIFLQLIFSRWS